MIAFWQHMFKIVIFYTMEHKIVEDIELFEHRFYFATISRTAPPA